LPTFTTTAKYALRRLTGSNVISDIDAGFSALADDTDALLTPSTSGTLAARPTSTVGTPGKLGRTYMATDQTPPRLFRDNGTGWDEVALDARPRAKWYTNGGQSIPNNAPTYVNLDQEQYDVGFGITPPAGYIVLPRAGLYLATGMVQIVSLATFTIAKLVSPFTGYTVVAERAWVNVGREDTLSSQFVAGAGDHVALSVVQMAGISQPIDFASLEVAYLGA
jgi:hypothetical protein